MFVAPLGRADAGIVRAQRRARRATAAAKRKIPRAPTPALPVLRNPTKAQDKAVARLTVASVKRAAGQAPRGTSRQDRAQLEKEYLQDARSGPRGAAVRGASRRLGESRALQALRDAERQLSRSVGGSRQQRLKAGEALLAATTNRSTARPGRADKRVGFGAATINATVLSRTLGSAIQKGDGVQLSRFLSKDVRQFAGRAGSDAVNFPKNAVLGVVEVGKAGADLSRGDSRRAKRIVSSLDDGPVGRIVQGDFDGAAKSLSQNPLYGLLEFTGAGSVAGRSAGAGIRTAGRLGPKGNALARAGSTKRDDLVLVEGTNQRLARSYSKNALVKATQVASEKRARARGLDPNQARPSSVPGRGQGAKMDAAVDEFAAQAEGMRRRGRDDIGAKAKGLAPKGKGRGKLERDVVFAAVERRLRGPETFEKDLRSERDRLQTAYRERRLAPDARQANRAQVKAIDRVLGDPKALANAKEVFRAAGEYTKIADDLERGRVGQNLLDPRQAEIAKVRPFAIARMGARPMDEETSARLVSESRDRTGQSSVARAEARDAERAVGRVEKQAQLVVAYQRATDQAVAPEQRQVARKAVVRLRGELDLTQGQVRRLAAQGVPDVAEARRAAVVARRRADDQRAGLPAREQEHADALGDREEAVRDVASAEKRAKAAARARSEAIGAQRAGGKASPATRQRAERRLAAAKADLVDARKRQRAAEKEAERTEPGRKASGLQDSRGEPLLTDDILAAMKREGVPSPGFVAQRRDQTGAKAYFQNWYGGRKTADAKGRTGEGTRQGSYDTSYQALTDSLVAAKGQLDAVGSFDDFIGQFASKSEGGKPFTWDEAVLEAQQRAAAPGGVEWVPVRNVPARYDAQRQAAIAAGQDVSSGPQINQYMVSRIDQARQPPEGKSAQSRNVVLVPARQLQRFEDHQTSGSLTVEKAFQKFTGLFRNAVLPTSTKWLTGNVVEGVGRLAVAGVSPADFWTGGRVMKELRAVDEDAWRAMDVRVKGGLLFGAGDRLTIRRGEEDFKDSILEGTAKAGAAIGRTEGVKQVLGAVEVMQKGIFGLNRGLERAFQQGVIGRQARRDAEEITQGWGQLLVMQKSIVREVAQGLTGTPKQVQYARAADEILGKYSRFSPSTRRVIQAYAPFLPWFLNAAKFVGYTLPVKHPAKTALLTSIEREFQKEWEEAGKDLPPGDLRYNPRKADGGVVNVSRFTPFSAFQKGPKTIVDPLLPQMSGAVAIVSGRNFTGNKLKMQDGEDPSGSKKFALAMYSIMESTVFGASLARRLQEKGESPFDDSTLFAPRTKPGTSFGAPSDKPVVNAANRILNPVKPTYLSEPSGQSDVKLSPAARRERDQLLREARAAAAEGGPSAREREQLLREARLAAGR